MDKTYDAVTGIKAKLLGLGPVLPGSLGKQWNVCGTPGCKCKDPMHPSLSAMVQAIEAKLSREGLHQRFTPHAVRFDRLWKMFCKSLFRP